MQKMHVPQFSELISKSLELYKANFRRLFTIAVIASVIGEISQVVANNAGLSNLMQIAQTQGVDAVQGALSGHVLLTILVMACLAGLSWLIAHAVCVYVMNESWQGHQIDMRVALKYVLACIVSLIVATILVKLVTAIGLVLYLIPGIVISALFLVYVPIIIFDNQSSLLALKRSIVLVSNFFLPTLGVGVFIFILMVIPDVIGMIMRSMMLSDSVGFGIDQVVVVFLSAFLLPLASALILTQYHALKAVEHNKQFKSE